MIRSATNGFAVSIEAGCNGVEATIVLLRGHASRFPRRGGTSVVGLAIGIVAVQVLNVVRVISLFYIGQWDFAVFEWAHQYVWQALIMLDVLDRVADLGPARAAAGRRSAAAAAPPALAAG